MNIKRLTAMLAGALFAAVSQQAAAAKGPEYTYAEIGYENFDGDFSNGDGGGVNISFGSTDHVFLKFDYSRLFVDFSSVPPTHADADRFQVGGGAHYGITDTIDVLGALSYVDIEYSNGVPAYGDDGYLAEIGVRAMLSKALELNATVSSLHLDGDNNTGYGVGAVFDITKTFALSGSYNHLQDDGVNEFFVGVRMGM
jgi:hypothetical protein